MCVYNNNNDDDNTIREQAKDMNRHFTEECI